MKHYVLFILSVCIVSKPVNAESYRASIEIDGGLVQDDFFIAKLTGDFYLKPVVTKNSPYGLESFLGKSSSLSFSHGTVKADDYKGIDVSRTDNTVKGFYVLGTPFKPVTASFKVANYEQEERSSRLPNGSDSETNIIDFELGMYLSDSTWIGLKQKTKEIDHDLLDEDSTKNGLELSYFGVFGLDTDNPYSLKLAVEKTEVDDFSGEKYSVESYLVSGRYFISNRFSLKAGFGSENGGNGLDDGVSFSGGASFYFTSHVASSINFKEYKSDKDSQDDYSSIVASLIVRY